MKLAQLELINFKNYEELNLSFGTGVNCLTGPNGSGKTNLLDALHYLSMCRSYFAATDVQNVRHGEKYFMIRGEFTGPEGAAHTVACTVREGQKKQFLHDGKPYDRMYEHMGRYPVVMIAPVDQELVTGGSGLRRKFMDRIIAQVDRSYLEELVAYQRVLEHRNALLRQSSAVPAYTDPSIQVWNEQLVTHGEAIHAKRRQFISYFNPLFDRFYKYVTAERETAALEYTSQLAGGPMEQLLREGYEKDRALRFTTVGTHKDDLHCTINGHAARKFGSQGQQKSFVTAMKLAHFAYIHELKTEKPIVMLDDLFDKLDDDRVSRIIRMVGEHSLGQLFISDTHPERVARFLQEAGVPFQAYHVRDGAVKGEEAYAEG